MSSLQDWYPYFIYCTVFIHIWRTVSTVSRSKPELGLWTLGFVFCFSCDNAIIRHNSKDNLRLKSYIQRNDETCNPEYHLAYRRYRFLLHLCRKHPSVALAAIYGLQQAVKQCQLQMTNNRWDCTSGFSSRMNKDFTLLNDPPLIKYGKLFEPVISYYLSMLCCVLLWFLIHGHRLRNFS